MRNLIRRRSASFLALATAVVATPFAWASFQSPHVAPFHGQPCTEYSSWETFIYAYAIPNPPDDPASTAFDAGLEQLDPNGVITPQGNIDNQTVPPAFRITDTVPADLQEIDLQVSIHLNQFDWSSVVLKYVDGASVTQSVPPTSSMHTVFQMGHEERLITWDLSQNADTITSYVIEFTAAFTFTQLDAVKLDTRYACAPGVVFCAGDGTGVSCPCASGAPGRGCENSFGTGGGLLGATGTADLANDTLVLVASSLPPTTSALFFQGTSQILGGAGAVFGDGKRCAGGSVVRMGARTTSGGTVSFGHGIGADPDISVVGQIPAAGVTRYYQVWYRNVATYCTSATYNLTNGLAIAW